MKMFKQKKQTTEEILQGAMTRIGSDVERLNAQRETALGVFNQAHCQLCAINADIEQSVQRFREIAEFAMKQAESAEKTMKANEHVCEQIRAIVGE